MGLFPKKMSIYLEDKHLKHTEMKICDNIVIFILFLSKILILGNSLLVVIIEILLGLGLELTLENEHNII